MPPMIPHPHPRGNPRPPPPPAYGRTDDDGTALDTPAQRRRVDDYSDRIDEPEQLKLWQDGGGRQPAFDLQRSA